MQSRSQGIINFMHFRVIAILHKQVAKPRPPQREPRKPLAGRKKAPPERGWSATRDRLFRRSEKL